MCNWFVCGSVKDTLVLAGTFVVALIITGVLIAMCEYSDPGRRRK